MSKELEKRLNYLLVLFFRSLRDIAVTAKFLGPGLGRLRKRGAVCMINLN